MKLFTIYVRHLCIFLGQKVFSTIQYILFCIQAFSRILRWEVSYKLIIQHAEFIGNRSLSVVFLAAVIIGAVFAIQFGKIFRMFGVESLIGASAGFALSKELAPVIGSFLVAGRAGSAIAAEIANMKVNEQIDALKISAVDPINYLVTPRIIASMLMTPLLTALFMIIGIISAYIVSANLFSIDLGIFIEKIRWIVKPEYIIQGLVKSLFFGFVLSSLACYHGFYAFGGAKDVGNATTKAVVTALVSILISDFFISYFQMSEIL